MANSLSFRFAEDKDINALIDHVAKNLQFRGYRVMVFSNGSAITLLCEKNNGGFNAIIGRCESIRANFIQSGGAVTVYFTDEAWTDKIIGLFLGPVTCGISWIFTGIGTFNQLQLPKIIENEIIIFTGTGPNPYTPPFTSAPPPRPTPPPEGSWTGATKRCDGCGNQINAAATYCRFCGKKQ